MMILWQSVCGVALAAFLAASCVHQRSAATSDANKEQDDRLWRQLGAWTYVDGTQGMPESVRRLSGSTVRISGYPLPIDGNQILLVPSLLDLERGAFQLNQAIVVSLADPPSRDLFTSRVRIAGVLRIEAHRVDGYCTDIYQMRADEVEILESWSKTRRVSVVESRIHETMQPTVAQSGAGG